MTYNGGVDGGDGHGTSGYGTFGHGEGKSLASYPMEQWTLSPGSGGAENIINDIYHFGGGGGGVLVNGEGPKQFFPNQGQGYGGGGYLPWSPGGQYQALPGVILLECECPY